MCKLLAWTHKTRSLEQGRYDILEYCTEETFDEPPRIALFYLTLLMVFVQEAAMDCIPSE